MFWRYTHPTHILKPSLPVFHKIAQLLSVDIFSEGNKFADYGLYVDIPIIVDRVTHGGWN